MTTGDPFRLAAPPEAADDDPPVSAIMSTKLVAIVPTAALSTALRLMIASRVRHLPVLEDGRCTALASEVDLLQGIAAEHGPLGVARLAVGDVARRTPSVPAEARLSEAAHRMRVADRDAVVVIRDDRLLGIVTATDLIRAWAARATPPAPPE
ncbi:MAG: CBS domain-containing protein [Pseudonocardia sp.]|nr:CBS domain-containing protein [Pseudonocardia sp.]